MARTSAEEAVVRALELRQQYGYSLDEALCPVDLAAKLGIQVWFKSLRSLEGLYLPGTPPLVVLGSQRPTGRRTYTCAHELGHHVFGHGHSFDEILNAGQPSRTSSLEEYVANRFAAALLMPKLGVCAAFSRRRWQAENPTTDQVLIVAVHLGVGYRTLVSYMERTLFLLRPDRAAELRKVAPKDIRRSLLSMPVDSNLLVVDEYWNRPVDIEIGDLVVAPAASHIEGCAVATVSRDAKQLVLCARRPGVARLHLPNGLRVLLLRSARPHYEGLATYRHLEDPDYAR